MQNLTSRMTYLRNAEAFCSVAAPAALCFDWNRSGGPVAWGMRSAALVLVSYIVLQGVLYWHLKLRSVEQRQPFPPYFQPLFRCFQYTNVLLIATVAVLIAAMYGTTAPVADLAWSYGLLGFTVLEQINYYHYQLMYDTRAAFAYLRRNGRLRKAALGLDLQRQQAM